LASTRPTVERHDSGTGSNAGTDTYNYDPLGRMTADSQSGPSGTTSSSTDTYNDNGEISKVSVTGNSSPQQTGTYGYASTGSDPGSVSATSSGPSRAVTWPRWASISTPTC